LRHCAAAQAVSQVERSALRGGLAGRIGQNRKGGIGPTPGPENEERDTGIPKARSLELTEENDRSKLVII
jgi:hypothetical protein